MNRAKFMDLVIYTRSLAAKLIAGDVQDLKALIVILSVHLLDRCVLRREAAAGSSVDHHEKFMVPGTINYTIAFFIHFPRKSLAKKITPRKHSSNAIAVQYP